MSNDNVVNFPTTNNTEEEVEPKVDTSRLALVQKNRSSALVGLNSAIDKLEESIRRLPQDGVVVEGENGDVFNLNQALREILQGIQMSLTGIEAGQALQDMIVHDLAGSIGNLEQIAASSWQSNMHLQVLMEVLQQNGVINEDQLRTVWEKLVPDAIKKMKESSSAQ